MSIRSQQLRKRADELHREAEALEKREAGLDQECEARPEGGAGLARDLGETTKAFRPTRRDLLEDLFTYHSPDPFQEQSLVAIRTGAKHFAEVLMQHTPDCPDQSAALRKLRECVMTANASIVLRGRV
jgi:hypothetical protein